MNKAIPLLPLWAFVACYWVTFTFTFYTRATCTTNFLHCVILQYTNVSPGELLDTGGHCEQDTGIALSSHDKEGNG
jgi:hypothetical protein